MDDDDDDCQLIIWCQLNGQNYSAQLWTFFEWDDR